MYLAFLFVPRFSIVPSESILWRQASTVVWLTSCSIDMISLLEIGKRLLSTTASILLLLVALLPSTVAKHLSRPL